MTTTYSMKDDVKAVSVDYLASKHIACINFNFNEHNTFNVENITLLSKAIDRALSINTTRCIIFNSTTPDYFSDGFSLKEMFSTDTYNQLEEGVIQRYDQVVDAYSCLIKCPIPTISFVNGICRGGGFEWALSSDFIVSTPNSKFALHEVRIGIVPGLGGSEMIKSKGNLGIANYCLLTGNYLSSSQAVTAGVVEATVDDFQEMLDRFVSPISRHPRLTLLRSKSFINLQETKLAALHGSRKPFLDSLRDKLKVDTRD